VARLPLIMDYPLPDDLPFQPYPHSRVFDDPGKMLFNELVHAFRTSILCRDRLDDDLPCTVRPNFGTVLIASLFGATVEQVGENPPWARHFDTREEFEAALDTDPLDYSRGWCPRVLERYRFYHEALSGHAKLKRLVKVVLPDLQGPLDNAGLLRGSEILAELHSDPGLVARALSHMAAAQVGFARHLAPYVTDGPDGFAHQHATMICGNILLRSDSMVMISPDMYRGEIAPHDEHILRSLGGGGVHSCGSFQHQADGVLGLESIRCIDFGQPEMNDIDTVYAKAREKGIALIRVGVPEAELTSGRVMDRFPTGVSLLHHAASIEDGQRILTQYKAATGG